MSDTPHEHETPETTANPVHADDVLAANDAILEEKLAQPIFRGDKGVETAQVWMSAFLVAVVGIIAYSNAFRLPFHSEDQRLIVDNVPLHAIATWVDGITLWPEAPLAMVHFARNWWLTPDNATGFHAVNILLHLINGLLVFMLLRKLTKTAAPPTIPMLLAMLYVVHPIHTASVDLIVGRAQLITIFLSLAGLLFYLRAITSDKDAESSGVRPGALVLSLLCFMFAYFCGFAFAFVLIVAADIAFGRIRTLRRCLPIYAIYLATTVLVVGVRMAIVLSASAGQLEAPTFLHCLRDSLLLNNAQALSFHLIPSYPITIAMVVVIIAAAFCYRSSASVFGRKPGVRTLLTLAGVIVLLFAMFTTYQRNLVYADPFTLWSDASARNPQAAEPLLQLGRSMMYSSTEEVKQRATEAERYFRQAIEIDSTNPDTYANLGQALSLLDRVDDARDAFLSGLRLDLNHKECTISLAYILSRKANQDGDLSKLSDAVDIYRRADSMKALSPELLMSYGNALISLGHLNEADAVLTRAIAAFKGAGAPQEILGQIEAQQKNAQDSIKRITEMQQQAMSLQNSDPASPLIPKLYVQALLMQGRPLQAFYLLDRFSQSPAFDFGAWVLMGVVKAKLKAGDSFVAEFATPPAKPAEITLVWREVARACAGNGMWDEAQRYLESAPAVAEDNTPPLFVLAEIAQQFKQTARAKLLLQKAAEAQPASPQPWLKLCDLALSMNDKDNAAKNLTEAESRGASADELTTRRQQIESLTKKQASGTVSQ